MSSGEESSSGGLKRHRPRRLFSSDSSRSAFSSRTRRTPSASTASVNESENYNTPPFSPPNQLEGVQEGPNEDDPDNSSPQFIPERLVASPDSFDSFSQASQTAAFRRVTGHLKATTSPSSSSSTPLSPNSKWGAVRQHVLPGDSGASPHEKFSSTPDLPHSEATPHKPQTKTRLAARLGFRQVAETAREVALDENVKFSMELLKACNAAYFVDPSKHKPDPIYMHMMSTAPINPLDMSVAVLPDPFMGKGRRPTVELRRPASIQSLPSLNKPIPSLRPIYQVLHKYSTFIANSSTSFANIPYESQVLSSILAPFVDLDKTTPQLEEERNLAYESFDILTHHWRPRNELEAINRCLWCCQSAAVQSPVRGRILQCLWGILVPASNTQCRISTPGGFKTLLHGLIHLQALLHDGFTSSPSPNDQQDRRVLEDLLAKVIDEQSCVDIPDIAIEEAYNALWLGEDDRRLVTKSLVLESYVACLANGLNRTRRILLRHFLERYWPILNVAQYTPLLSILRLGIINAFTQAAVTLIPFHHDAAHAYSHLIIRTLTSRVLSELEAIEQGPTIPPALMRDIQNNIVGIILKAWTLKDVSVENWASKTLHTWCQRDARWKAAIEVALENIFRNEDWSRILEVLPMILGALHDASRKPLVIRILPSLYDRIVEDPPPLPCEALTSNLMTLSSLYPQAFFKPLFSCAASSNEIAIANHAAVLAGLSRFVPNFWLRDPEMICVALSSDTKQAPLVEAAGSQWAVAKIGQSLLLIQMISQVQQIRHGLDMNHATSPEAFLAEAIKFFGSLESRLSLLLDLKDNTASIPPSQRLLYTVLFREIRLLTRSNKKPTWSPRVISWFAYYHLDDEVAQYTQREVEDSISQIENLFNSAIDGIRASGHRRSTLALSKGAMPPSMALSDEHSISSFFSRKATLLASLKKGFPRKALKLLVAIAPMLTTENLKKIGPFVWDQHLDEVHDTSTTCAAAFLIMLCAEKIPRDLMAIIEVDFRSSDEFTRLSAVKRIAILLDFRYQLASQQVVSERSHRLFRVARAVLPFVQADMGTTDFILEETMKEEEQMPTELRKRLAEIGWAEEAKAVDPLMHWIQTPVTLLPSHHFAGLTKETTGTPANPTPERLRDPSDVTSLLRRNSSTGGPIYGVKRRPIFVPALASILPRMALLAFDPNLAISTTVKKILLDLLRNDPTLLTRPVHEMLTGDAMDLDMATSALRAFLHIRRILPPTSTHDMFNYLSGFLKYDTRQTANHVDVLHDFSSVIPVLATLASQVDGISTREFRRAKLEHFFIPYGGLYFTSMAPEGPMFPRASLTRPYDRNQILELATVRTSQNFLFYHILKRYPQDVHHLRRNLTVLELPADENYSSDPLRMQDFTPRRTMNKKRSALDPIVTAHSLMLARSYLLLVGQIFRSLSRHLNDKEDLAILIDSVNRILLVHGNDIGVVGQALVALMIASVRFRRLFTSGGSYALFMPAILKVYAEAPAGSGIRLAIEYAAIRFFALHRDSFIFQTLVILAEEFSVPGADCDWLGQTVFSLTSAMMRGVDTSTPDPAGIHDVNRSEERDALLILTAEEKPQTFLAPGGSQIRPHEVNFMEEVETSKLVFDNMVRLFLTVIAHDHTILRAQQFLKFLRFLTPQLYAASSASRAVLQEGIDALGAILMRAIPQKKDGADSLPDGGSGSSIKLPSNLTAMRVDFLFVISSFCRAGGLVQPPTIRQAFSLMVLALRDTSQEFSREISSFISELCSHVLLRSDRPPTKHIVYFLRDASVAIEALIPVTRADFSSLFDAVLRMLDTPQLANDQSLIHIVTEVLCPAALKSCQDASSRLALTGVPWTASLVNLLSRATRLRGGDVLKGIERITPSYQFMARIVLPLVLQLWTISDLKASVEPLDSSTHTSVAAAWFRMLAYAMSASGSRREGTKKAKGFDRKKQDDTSEADAPTLLISLQTIKAIIVRGGSDLTRISPGIWIRLSVFISRCLEKGGSRFAVPLDRSPFASPLHSPRASAHLESSSGYPFPSPRPSLRPSFHNPSLLDYALWSWLELMAVHRNPLVPHLRIMTQEKLHILDTELQNNYGHQLMKDTMMGRGSFAGSNRVSTIFTKPRKRLSGLPSPQGSPYLGPSASSTPRHSVEFGVLPEHRQAGWAISATASPSRGQDSYPQIVHLGPASPLDPPPSINGWGLGPTQPLPDETIRSMLLTQQTYHRIRTVQSCHGYEALLPLPDGTTDSAGSPIASDVAIGVWTQSEAIKRIVQETSELLAEFDESFSFGLGDESLQHVNEADLSFTIDVPGTVS